MLLLFWAGRNLFLVTRSGGVYQSPQRPPMRTGHQVRGRLLPIDTDLHG